MNRCPRWNNYSENGAFATTSAKFGGANPSTYLVPKSRRILSKLVAGFRRTMLQRDDLSWYLSAQPRKLREDRALFVQRNLIKTKPDRVHGDSRMGHCDLRLFVKGDGTSGVKGDRIPDDLRLLCRDTALLHKCTRYIGAVDLEPFLRRVPVGQTQIVQNGGNGQEFGIWQGLAFSESRIPNSQDRITWLKRYGSDELRARSIASRTSRVSVTLIPAKIILGLRSKLRATLPFNTQTTG